MTIKIVFLFLIGILVLAMFGRLSYPGKTRIDAMKCPKCGRYKLGKRTCDCQRKG